MCDRDVRIEAEHAIAIEQRWRAVAVRTRAVAAVRACARRMRAFNRQQAQLRGDAAVGGEAAQLAVGGEHAMTGDDDGERIAAEGLSNRARGAGNAELCGDVAVRDRRAGWNRARDFVDAAVE